MKRMMLFFLLAVLLFAGCAGRSPSGSGDKLKVTAAAFPEYDFVRAVAGDLAEITLLLPPGAEAHSYEPTPQDIARIGACRVFVYGGGESDVWLDRILDSGDREGKIILSLMDCCALREEEIQEFMTAEEEEEEEETEYDEHVWTSPVNAIAITNLANAVLYTRNSMIDVLHEDYIRTAYSKGNSKGRVLRVHALKNALIPTVTVIGMEIGFMVGGATVTETVFSWPGVGRLVYDAVNSLDYPVLQGAFLVMAVAVVVMSFITDLVVAWLDPRIKLGG